MKANQQQTVVRASVKGPAGNREYIKQGQGWPKKKKGGKEGSNKGGSSSGDGRGDGRSDESANGDGGRPVKKGQR